MLRSPAPLISRRLMATFAIAATCFAAQLTPTFADDRVATMSLSGVGEVAATPDMAILTSGVITQAKTAREALTANNQAMANLMETLTGMNVDPKDIQTSNFSVQPEFTYNNNNNNSRRIVGYTVSNNVTVRVRELENLGQLLDGFVSVGANQIYNVSFAVQDPTEYYAAARKAAVADALEKANLYADAAGIKLGPIMSISESGGAVPRQAEMAMMRVAADSAVPVASGELSFSSSVHIQWDIGQD